MSARNIRYGQLPGQPLPGVYLMCPSCRETFSAASGDYWGAPSETVCKCGDCDVPLRLVRREVTYVNVSPEEAQ